jgi:hypothetical protein
MSGQATTTERLVIGHELVKTLEEMDLDSREQISVLFVALIVIWKNERHPVTMFDKMVAHVRNTIDENWKEIS